MNSKKIAILQSNYIPWKGYFDIINMVDEFIIFDEAQYTKNDWRNRNIIKTATGPAWITIPVKHNFGQRIIDAKVFSSGWNIKHWKTLVQNYSKSTYFKQYKDVFEHAFFAINTPYLSEINISFIKLIAEHLSFSTTITPPGIYKLEGDKTERLVSICKQAGAKEYISGPAAKGYINEELFFEEGIKLNYMNYSGYKEYNQLYPPFMHSVTILDLLFNTGPEAKKFLLTSNY